MTRQLVLLLTALVALVALPAAAQVDENTKKARRLYAEATQAFEAQRYPEAARGFEAAHQLRPHAVALYTAAQAWEAAGETARAADAYELALATPTLEPKRLKRARKKLADLRRRLGIVIASGDEGLRVRLDDHMAFEVPARLHGAPGLHSLSIIRKDGTIEQRSVTLRAGESVKINANPRPTEVPLAPPRKNPVRVIQVESSSSSDRAWKVAGYATAGAGLAGLAGAAVLGLSANDAEDAYRRSPTQATFDHASDLERRTNIMLAVGGALTAAGVGIIVWQSVRPKKERHVPSAKLGVGPGGVFAQGRF